MATKTLKDKVKNTAFVSDMVLSDKEKTKITMQAPIDERESVMIYGSEVIYTEDDKANPPCSLQSYQGSQFIMCPPFGTSNGIANNAWMQTEDLAIDRYTYHEEWLKAYKDMSSLAMVYLTPTHPKLQDQVYISNGMWIPFHANKYCVMPNFKVEGRKANEELGIPGENAVNAPFMKMLGYEIVYLPEFDEKGEPMYFEGSADIKMINCKNPHATVWVCGVGIRTSENAARWIENWLNEIDTDPNSAHKVISYPQHSDMTYHLDCAVEPADCEHTVVYYQHDEDGNVYEDVQTAINEIAKYTKIIPLEDDTIAAAGACNFVRNGQFIFINSDIQMLEGIEEFKEDYEIEKKKLGFIQKNVCEPLGLDMNVYCMSEAIKGGACYSCCCLDARGWDFINTYDWAYQY